MIQFLWSNIECFEYLSHVHQIFLRCQSCMSHIGVLLYSQWPDFHQVIWGGLQIFYYKIFCFATSFPIFKLLNSVVINMFKVIKKCLCYSSSLHTETEAAYENFKLWLEIKHIVVSWDDYKQKKWWPDENRAHTLLVVLCGEWRSFGFVISTSLINYLETWKGTK